MRRISPLGKSGGALEPIHHFMLTFSITKTLVKLLRYVHILTPKMTQGRVVNMHHCLSSFDKSLHSLLSTFLRNEIWGKNALLQINLDKFLELAGNEQHHDQAIYLT